MTNHVANRKFEDDVRKVAEALWGLAPGACQPQHYVDSGPLHELDGLARLRDVSHLLMVTVSTKLEKVKDDVKKLHRARDIEKRTAPACSMWLITEKQLDAQHIEHARQHDVTAISMADFQRRFFDGREYLAKRLNYPFGSARDPQTNGIAFDDNAYVQLPIRCTNLTRAGAHRGDQPSAVDISLARIIERLASGEIFVLMAPFGAGKSVTAREIHKKLAWHYLNGNAEKCPITINLRDHWGQDYGDEILDRHARQLGLKRREDLVAAWRAGMVTLIIDGFDEVASQGILRRDDKHFLRDSRRRALEGIKDFITKIPPNVGALIVGRDHYFDTVGEMEHSLGLTGKVYNILRLGEFDERGASDFLSKQKIGGVLPDWLPRKPLLLGYLASQKLLPEVLAIDGSKGFGYTWDIFLDRICEREAALERAVMDPQTVRRVMERLACEVRCTTSGTGPLTGEGLSRAYFDETGQQASEGVLAQLQRLPGLSQSPDDATFRAFIDEDLLCALQGCAIGRMLVEHWSWTGPRFLDGIRQKASAMSCYFLSQRSAKSTTVISVINDFNRELSTSTRSRISDPQVVGDGLQIAIDMAVQEEESLDCRSLVLDGVEIGRINLHDIKISDCELRSCIVGDLQIGSDGMGSSITLRGCSISAVSGVSSRDAIPTGLVSEDCTISDFDQQATNSAVLKTDWPPELKALVTVLRKLYRQAGAGRKIAALKRGLPPGPVLDNVDRILGILEKEGLASRFNQVIHPVRRQSGRVEKILDAPLISTDSIVKQLAQ